MIVNLPLRHETYLKCSIFMQLKNQQNIHTTFKPMFIKSTKRVSNIKQIFNIVTKKKISNFYLFICFSEIFPHLKNILILNLNLT